MADRIVGLDIGTSAIRAVELTTAAGALPILEAYGQVGLPPGAVVDGEIRDRSAVTAALTRLWREGGFTERRVLIGVAGLRAITREVDMPVLPPEELEAAVRFKADEVVPFPLDRTAFSSKVIARYSDAEGVPTLRVLVAAAHRDLIDGVLAVTAAAGLQPVGIDLNTAALVRALHDPSFSAGPEAIVSVGAGLTMVVVHQAGTLLFVRTIDLGGESVSKSIASALDLPVADTEALKRRLSVDPDSVDPRARRAAEQAVDDLVGEIHNSIRFFSSLPGRAPVARVVVTGAGARTAGFGARLTSGLDIPVVAADPLSRVNTSGLGLTADQAEAVAATLAVPVGLALPDPTGNPFNLLPPEITQGYTEKMVRRYLVIAGIVLLLLLVALSFLRVKSVSDAKSSVKNLQETNARIQNVDIPRYAPVVALKQAVQAQQTEIAPIIYGEVDWLVVFNELGLYTLPTAATPTCNTPPTPCQVTWGTMSLSTGAAAGTAGGATSTGPPTPDQIIGTGSGGLVAPGIPGATEAQDTLSSAPAFGGVSSSGTFAPNASNIVTFQMSFNINGLAGSHRLSLIDQPIP